MSCINPLVAVLPPTDSNPTAFHLPLVAMLQLPATYAALPAGDYIKRGSAKFAQGDFSGALDEYHSACDAEPEGYMNFFKRATVYLATGRTRQAETDLAKVLELRPDMKQARKTIAELRLKAGYVVCPLIFLFFS